MLFDDGEMMISESYLFEELFEINLYFGCLLLFVVGDLWVVVLLENVLGSLEEIGCNVVLCILELVGGNILVVVC